MNKEQNGVLIDDSALETIEQLVKEYKQAWGKEPDLSLMFSIPQITQEKTVVILQHMIDTNDSYIVSYTKLKDKGDI